MKRPFLVIAFVVLFLVIFFHNDTQGTSINSVFQNSVFQNQIVIRNSAGLPVRLKIPGISVDAAIEYVGLTPKRAMEVPGNSMNVGWFKLGPHPGDKGSAVIAGHFDGENGERGVFADLYKLRAGDKLYIENDKGESIVFVVREIRTYDSGYADEVFSLSNSAHLNLVTCDGVWDGVKKSYSKRLVVFSDAS